MQKQRIHTNWSFWKEGHEDEKRTIDLPHDAMLDESRVPEMEGGASSAYFPGGKYVYEKILTPKPEWSGKSLILEFEGVYQNASVLLNDERLGGWFYGYTNFFIDLTNKLRDGENRLHVIADNSQTPNSRWYSGSGIYRPVNLWVGGENCIKAQRMRIKTLSLNPAIIHVDIEAANSEGCELRMTVLDGERPITRAEGFSTEITIPEVTLWSAETPKLYTLRAELWKDGVLQDTAEERFGVRSIAWNIEQGLLINGKSVKLRGGCIHHDNGILGAASFDEAERRRIKKLKDFGFNAIRYSHYPASKSVLDACDELGMYVLDESFDQWRIPNTTYDYSTVFDREWRHDLAALVAKDYSHPCVILYCIGNEITDTGRSYGKELAAALRGFIRERDDTRPVILASNIYLSVMGSFMEEQEIARGATMGSLQVNEVMNEIMAFRSTLTMEKIEELTGPSFDAVDIAGYNYATDRYVRIHELRPDRIVLSSETLPAKMAENWRLVHENPWCIGDFHWTAWDYLGEAGVGLPVYGTKEAPFSKAYPCLTAACGDFDLLGFPETAAYYAAILWGKYKKPFIAVRPVDHAGEDYTVGGWRLTDAIPCWTWPGCEGKTAEIQIYAPGAAVELWQDGVSLGRKPLEDGRANYSASYRKGCLEAVCFDVDGAILGKCELESAGEKFCLHARPERSEIRADREQIVYVPIELTDEKGVLRMTDDVEIRVAVSGPAELIALGSASPVTEESFFDDTHQTWHGRAMAVLRSTGEAGTIRMTARSNSCGEAAAIISAK